MPVPEFLKSTPFLASTGAVATGAVGIGGGQLMDSGESANSPMYMPFHSGNVPKLSNLGITAETSSDSDWGKSYDCFSELFNGLSFSHTGSSASESISDSDANKLKINSPSDKGKENPVGCAMFQLSQKLDKKKPYGTLRAEVAVKNEKVGWTLGIGGEGFVANDGSSQYQQQLQYRLIFLAGEDSKGNIKGGYHGNDDDLSANDEFNIKVVVPGEDGEWINKKCENANASDLTLSELSFNDFSDSAQAELKGFSGVGKVSEDDQDKEVFQDMVVSPKDDSTNAYGILGKRSELADSKINVASVYKPEESKWVTYKKAGESSNYQSAIKDTLEDWYSPFKGKKGKGTKLN